ncbi:hypothetical protein [Nocardia pseudobrasiliensis]|uniref:Uncharacterized protein n=1 Tax=Nocardia pseudobrasiliensis TaxID=45979 RepID=A0A370IAW2_9NOCA|nr:hypothetical protein [Nocardia pseudobrasiliensis]RDI67869.1 hypothetical protein DFR76_102269 [Nocardia pseudobrasiliensis]
MIAIRIILLGLGIAAGAYGVALLLEQNPADLRSVVIWFAGGILVHDFVFAPVCAALGAGARRLVPRGWWAGTVYGSVCSVALIAVALPVVGREHAVTTNETVLDRPYALGLIAALAVVWGAVAFITGLDHRRVRVARRNRIDS